MTAQDFKVEFVDLGKIDLRGRVAPQTDKIVADACRKHPGQWALLPLAGRKPTSIAITINGPGSKAFPKGEFRSTKRGDKVYVQKPIEG